MKIKLILLRLNELLCCSSLLRRAERLSFPGGNLIADIECHVFSFRVDPTHIHIQPAFR
jgi:hypothetical protein